jgi:regulator of replication initiation timing
MIKIPIQADVDEAGKKIEEFAKKSRTALNSLSLVAQDLPFGFIGIQNNLPGVISSFGELTREAGGVGGALKQLGSALIGPAGLFLAFSAVTASVTFLIQKYGSLSAGIAALISNNAKLIEVQNSLNKELATTVGGTAAETAKIQILVKSINDLSKPMKERQDAYVALKKIAPEIARGIGEENTLTQKNIDLINENSKARIEYIKLRARENAINSIINKNEVERIGLEQEFPALLARKQKAEAAYNKVKGISFDGTKTFNAGLQTEAINLESATNALDKNAKQRRDLFKINDGLIKQLTPLVDGTAKYDAATKEFTESLKKQRQVKEKSVVQKGELGPGTLLDTAAAFAAYVKGNINIQKASIDKILRERNSYRRKEIDEGLGVPKKIDKIAAAPLSKELEILLGRFQLFQAALAENAILLNQTFFQPLENAFMNLFETGKFGFKAFADAVLKQIQQLVSKIIATGIISLIANLMSGGLSGVAGGIGGVLARVGGDILKAIGIGGVANPSFGGVGAGSMGMSGQVNVVLRGSDLVGALNRTNATINRVG